MCRQTDCVAPWQFVLAAILMCAFPVNPVTGTAVSLGLTLPPQYRPRQMPIIAGLNEQTQERVCSKWECT